MRDELDGFILAEGDPPSKREVLRCALHLFVRDGLCETSIRDIANASGYTNPALYKFFKSKHALALHLFERCYLRLFFVLSASQRPDLGFEANLDSLWEAYGRLVGDSLEAVLYVNETLRFFWPKLSPATRRHSLLRVVGGLLDQGMAEGVIRPETDLVLALAAMGGAMTQIARMAYFGEVKRPISGRVAGLRALFRQALLRSGTG